MKLPKCDRVKIGIISVAIFVILVWLLTGTVFYRFASNCSSEISCSSTGQEITQDICGWSWEESFYYSVQAGLSIGFGLLSESRQSSQLYTVFHILVGSSVISGALALFVSMAVARNQAYQDREEEMLNVLSLRLSFNGYSGFQAADLRWLLISYPHFYRDLLYKVEPDRTQLRQKVKKFVALSQKARAPLVHDLLMEAFEKLEEMKGGELSIEDLRKIHAEERDLCTRARCFVMKHAACISSLSLLGAWICVGITWCFIAEKWSFITSLYFAVSSISTGGLQDVTRKDSYVLFTGVYCLIGVPLYGVALGAFVNLLSDWYSRRQFDEKMNSKMTASDVEFVEHLLQSMHLQTLSLSEFTEIELLRLGLVDRNTLLQIRDKFQRLDTGTTGRLSTLECLASDEKRISLEQLDREHEEAGASASTWP